jgi:DNA-binding XRE family transcriptional regulator
MRSPARHKTLPSVIVELEALGLSVKIARKRRALTAQDAAVRANISRDTLVRIEKGDPGVSMGAYMSVFWLFGLSKQMLGSLAPESDTQGKHLEYAKLPLRVRKKHQENIDF